MTSHFCSWSQTYEKAVWTKPFLWERHFCKRCYDTPFFWRPHLRKRLCDACSLLKGHKRKQGCDKPYFLGATLTETDLFFRNQNLRTLCLDTAFCLAHTHGNCAVTILYPGTTSTKTMMCDLSTTIADTMLGHTFLFSYTKFLLEPGPQKWCCDTPFIADPPTETLLRQTSYLGPAPAETALRQTFSFEGTLLNTV